MLGVFADDHYMAVSSYDLALFADLLYGWFNLHYNFTMPFVYYLERQVILPLVRSYAETSTVTVSPGSIRI